MFELPLLKRELIESAQKKRTYLLRSICLVIFGLVFLTVYFQSTNRASNITRLLGSGQDMNIALWASSLFAIFALAPAMSCSAISSEMEKQTLGILLISKLSPWKIVVEKICSRMLPLLSLVVVVCPLLAISYLFGGTSVWQLCCGVYILLFVVLQITSVSVFCSVVFRKSQAAFWMTYIVLLLWYFSWPVLAEVFDLWKFDPFPLIADEEFMFFPIYQAIMLSEEASSWQEYALLTVPQLLMTVCFPVLAWRSLLGYVEGAPVNLLERPKRVAQFIAARLQRYKWGRWIVDHAKFVLSFRSRFRQLRIDIRQSVRTFVGGSPSGSDVVDVGSATNSDEAGSPVVPDDAICWREHRTGLFAKFPVVAVGAVGVLCLEWLSLPASRRGYSPAADVCALFSFGVLIVWLLLVMGQSCRIFAGERERQTLSVLLVSPISNADLLNQKLSAVNRIIRKGLWLLLIPLLFNVGCTNYRESNPLTYLLCSLGNAYIYMHIVKWTGTYFGLRTNTQMKAMVSSLVSILVFCFVPLLLCLVCMIGVGSRPADSPFFIFISPLIISALNEFHEVWRAVNDSWFPNSELLAVVFNFFVYGGICQLIKKYTVRKLPELLERMDDPQRVSLVLPDPQPV